MLRLASACLVLIVAPLTMGRAEELKPKFGDIGGVFYTEVSGDREACQQAIKNKIALCEQNSNFVSNTLDQKYPGCLPIFREQARVCIDHFRSEAFKCQGTGSVRIEDFTGFACTVTATVIEEDDETERTPAVVPADRLMQARTRTNVRSGPGTDHAKVGLLETGERVQVTGNAGEWLRIKAQDGSTAFVHGSLLVAPQSASQESSSLENAEEISKLEKQIEASRNRYEEARAAYSEAHESLKSALEWTSLDLVECITSRSGGSRNKREHDQQCRSRHAKLKEQKLMARNRLQGLSDIVNREGNLYWTLTERLRELLRNSR